MSEEAVIIVCTKKLDIKYFYAIYRTIRRAPRSGLFVPTSAHSVGAELSSFVSVERATPIPHSLVIKCGQICWCPVYTTVVNFYTFEGSLLIHLWNFIH